MLSRQSGLASASTTRTDRYGRAVSKDEREPTVVRKALSTLRRFSLGIASGGAYPVAKSVERELRYARRDEERRNEIEHEDATSEDS